MVLWVVSGIPIQCIINLGTLLDELIVRRSKHSVSFRKVTCLRQELTSK